MVDKQKMVPVVLTWRCDMEVPADWDDGMVEFFLNGSSFCADNLFRIIEQHAARQGYDCTCPLFGGSLDIGVEEY